MTSGDQELRGLAEQALELAGWRTAWMHEARGAHGEWERGVGVVEQRAGHLEVRGRQEMVSFRQDVAKRTPTGLLHQQIRDIEQQREQAIQRLPRPQIAGPMSPAARQILQQEEPSAPRGPVAGPMRMSASQAIPAIDHRVVVAYTANAKNVIAKAAQQGKLNPDQAKTIGDAVDSLTRTAQAADRQIQQLQDAQARNNARMDTLEQAMRDLHSRQNAELQNERLKDRIMSIRQKHDELVAEARENAAGKSRAIIGVSGALSTLALTLAAFVGFPGINPTNPHEWLLAIIPVVTAVGAAFVQPLYERMQDKKLARKTEALRTQEAAAAQAAADLQAGRDIVPGAPKIQNHSISMQLANQDQETWAIQWLSGIFAQCGLSGTQADELAEDLIATR